MREVLPVDEHAAWGSENVAHPTGNWRHARQPPPTRTTLPPQPPAGNGVAELVADQWHGAIVKMRCEHLVGAIWSTTIHRLELDHLRFDVDMQPIPMFALLRDRAYLPTPVRVVDPRSEGVFEERAALVRQRLGRR